jgi:hypothetical protein
MYQIFFNDLPIYDPRGADLGLIIRDPDCHLAVGEAGELSFTIDPDHPYAQELTKIKGVLELRADGVTIYKGRIHKDSEDFMRSREIDTEGLLACLRDSLVAPFNFPDDYLEDAAYQAAAENGNVIRFFLELLLAEHNSQVSPAQQIQLGDVTVTDPNNYISRSSSEYLTTQEAVKRKVLEPLGGYLLADYSGETTKLHYYADLPLTNTQVVEFGENLLDLANILDAADVYTAILPVGKDGLTIGSMDDGELTPGFIKEGEIIYSRAAEETYGGIRITRRVDWKDVTEARNLQTKALQTLSTEGVMLTQTIEAQAADLGGMDNVAKFRVGRYVELRSTPHGFSAAYPLMELDPDILNPGDTHISMGVTVKSASDLAHGNQTSMREELDRHQIALGQQQNSLVELAQTTHEQITSAVQDAQSIILKALDSYVRTSNLEDYKKTVESQLTVMANEIRLKFTEATERILEVDGDLQQTVTTLSKHFDFGVNGLDIKAGENAMTLTLDNDLILFKKNGQQFGWWDGVDFHTGNIVVDVNERAQFGSFAFVPRSNKSLSFLKVSD